MMLQVLPSGSDQDPSLDKVLDEKDVKIEVMRSGGAGGQVGISLAFLRNPQAEET